MFYELADDYLARRGQYREIHLKKAWESHARGELILGGALTDPVDSAVLLFSAESRAVPEEFAKHRSLRHQRHRAPLVRARVDNGRRQNRS